MNSLFSEGKYLLADSGYASLEHIVPTFKRSHRIPLSPAHTHFNNVIAKIRIASEHCNGMLKGRFGSLKELRLVISDERSAAHVCAWISACVVVHNFLIDERLAGDLGLEGLGSFTGEGEEPSEQAERSAEIDSALAQRRASLFEAFMLEHGY